MTGTDGTADAAAILDEARELLARPGNDFLWSDWDNASDALDEIDALSAAMATEHPGARAEARRAAGVLFAPTGPLQEVAQASGWHDAFAALAQRLDRLKAGANVGG